MLCLSLFIFRSTIHLDNTSSKGAMDLSLYKTYQYIIAFYKFLTVRIFIYYRDYIVFCLQNRPTLLVKYRRETRGIFAMKTKPFAIKVLLFEEQVCTNEYQYVSLHRHYVTFQSVDQN